MIENETATRIGQWLEAAPELRLMRSREVSAAAACNGAVESHAFLYQVIGISWDLRKLPTIFS